MTMSSQQALHDFLQANCAVTYTRSGDWMFEVDIFFKAAIGDKNFRSKVIVFDHHAFGSKLSILNREDIDPEEYFVEFAVNFQTFKFKKRENSLLITGSSPKVGGKYSVHISNPSKYTT